MRESIPSVRAALAAFYDDLNLQARQNTATTYERLLRGLGNEEAAPVERLHLPALSQADCPPLRRGERPPGDQPGRDRLAPLYISDLTPAICRAYAASRAPTLAPASMSTLVYAMRSFGNWCVAQGFLSENPAKGVPHPRVRPPVHQYLSADQVRRLYAASTSDTDRLVVALLAGCGLRAAELCGLRWRDVDLDTGLLRIFGKGSKWREVPVSEPALSLLRERYHVSQNLRSTSAQPPSLATVLECGTGALRQRVARLGKAIGMAVHPHMLRHTYAILFLEASGEDALSLQQLLGHASLALTGYYLRSFRQVAATKKARSVDLAGKLFSEPADPHP